MAANSPNIGITNAAMAGVFATQARGLLKPITGAIYTLNSGDHGKYLRTTAAVGVVLNVPADTPNFSFPPGGETTIEAGGAGGTVITPAAGVTINGASVVLAQHEVVHLRKVAPNTYTAY
jgi:hypothetical protein